MQTCFTLIVGGIEYHATYEVDGLMLIVNGPYGTAWSPIGFMEKIKLAKALFRKTLRRGAKNERAISMRLRAEQ